MARAERSVWACLLALLLLLTVTVLHNWGEENDAGAGVEVGVEDGVEDVVEPGLANLLDRAGSDQASHHGYHRYYDPLFAPLRHTRVRFLEIGVHQRESIAAWRQAHNINMNWWTLEAGVTIADVNV